MLSMCTKIGIIVYPCTRWKRLTMRIRVINPNTAAEMTREIGLQARRVASPDTEIVAVNPEMGPRSIECHYDETVAAVGVLDEVRKGEREASDAYVIACFGDPGLLATREMTAAPVIGIAEAAMHAASFLATGFSVVTTLERTCIQTEHLAQRYGMERFCRGIHGTDIPVLALENLDQEGWDTLVDCSQRALLQDRSAAIVLGCAGLSGFTESLQERLGVPVVDGLRVSIHLAEMFVRLGLRTSKRGDLAAPVAKEFTGLMSRFAWTNGADGYGRR